MNEIKHDREALRNLVLSEMNKREIDSHKAFADFVGVSQATITRIINDKHHNEPSLQFLVLLSEATGVYILDLIAMLYPDVVRDTAPAPSARVLAQQIGTLPESFQDVLKAMVIGSGAVNRKAHETD